MKEQGPVSPRTTTALAQSVGSDCCGTLEFIAALQLPGEDLDSKLWLIMTNFSS